MKRIGWVILILVLGLLTLPCCSQPEQAASQETPFDALAR